MTTVRSGWIVFRQINGILFLKYQSNRTNNTAVVEVNVFSTNGIITGVACL